MAVWEVTLPIAGHILVTVEADSEEHAIEKALDDPRDGEVTWEAMEKFNSGNVCHCPSPWKAEATNVDELL